MPPRAARFDSLAFSVLVGALVITACVAAPTASPTPSASPAATETPTPTPTGSAIPSIPVTGCKQQASGAAPQPLFVRIRDITAQTYPQYDVLIFDFDRGLPEYTITHVEPPFTYDASGLPLTVNGDFFFSIVFQGASIYDEEFQPVYEGQTDFQPNLDRIEHVVLAGDFEAVSSWVVGLNASDPQPCLAVQAFAGDRLVVAFVENPA